MLRITVNWVIYISTHVTDVLLHLFLQHLPHNHQSEISNIQAQWTLQVSATVILLLDVFKLEYDLLGAAHSTLPRGWLNAPFPHSPHTYFCIIFSSRLI